METSQALQYFVSTMQADSILVSTSTGGIWDSFAPISTSAPYTLITQQSGTDVLTANVRRLFVDMLFQIKAVGPASNYGALVTIADRIDALFGRVGVVALPNGGGILEIHRESTVSYPELVNGVLWKHIGGIYRNRLQGS